jgi:hypothetical protein
MKILGKNNDLRTEEGKITKAGYAVMLLSTVFGLCVFFRTKDLRKVAAEETAGLTQA